MNSKPLITTVEDRRYAAVLAADIATLEGLLHDDLVYGHSTGTRDSKATYIEALRVGTLKYHSIERTNRVFLERENFTLVFCTIDMSVTVEGMLKSLKNNTIAVWENSPERGWGLLASHSTPIKPG